MKAVNLLPADLRSGPKGAAPAVSAGTDDGGHGPLFVLGALALCVLALAGYVLTANTVKSGQVALAEATARSEVTNRQVAALKPYADFDSVAKARVATVNDLATSRFDWEQALRDLSRAMPSDATLSQINGTVSSTAGGGGAAASSLRGALDVPAIELQGCTRGQTDTARLMANLRNVDGVTRVSLSKSDKESATARPVEPAGAATVAPATGSGETIGACGKGDRPSFNVVVFFERAASAAAEPTVGAESTTASVPTGQPGGSTTSTGATSTPASATTSDAQGQSK